MSKNLKKDYLRKLAGIVTDNGYKVDLANYIYNPSHEHNYPTLKKLIEETSDTLIFREVQYFKYYNGNGEYILKEYSMPNTKDTWGIAKNVKEEVLEVSKRFSLNELITWAENC